jgi:hypothetical protein
MAAPLPKRLVAGFPPRRPGFAPGSNEWDFWWTKWHRGRFSPSTLVSPVKTVNSTNFCILTITRGRYNRPGVAAVPSEPSVDSTPPSPQYKKKRTDFTELEPFLRNRQLSSYSRTYQHVWNPKVHYGVLKSPLLVPILSHITPVRTIPSYLSNIHFNIVTHSLKELLRSGSINTLRTIVTTIK